MLMMMKMDDYLKKENSIFYSVKFKNRKNNNEKRKLPITH